MNEERIQGSGGSIFLRSWRPDGAPRGVVVIVHGFNSHSAYYDWVGKRLTAKGFAVYAPDLRGRGHSDGERYYVEHVSEYIDDVNRVVKLAKARERGLPLYMLGHSAGGVISCVYALEHPNDLAGLICESFAYKVPAPDAAVALIRGVSHIAPHVQVLRLKIDDFSRDPAVLKAMHDDPSVGDEVQPTLTVAAMSRADLRLENEFQQIRMPLFIMHGTEDKVTVPAGSQEFYDRAGSADKTLKLYDGYAHDLLNDYGKEEVMSDIENWLDARLVAATAGATAQFART